MASSTISILSILIITNSICSAAVSPPPWQYACIPICNDSESLKKASTDYGNIFHEVPTGVLQPSTEKDIIDLIKLSYTSPKPFTVAAKGRGHSVQGQAMAGGGVVVNMTALGEGGNKSRISIKGDSKSGFYADVGGEQLWIDLLKASVAEGVAPVSWTDYIYMSVGGTLSNGGISGQTFLHGPQISNVLELDVITGKGEFMTCSRTKNAKLFFGVLGGLGQFGIITRARIALHKAPTKVRWAKLYYTNFSKFSRDQEFLISINASDYVEGFLITNQNRTYEWGSSSSSPSRQSDVVALLKEQRIVYMIELVKYYDDQTASTIDQEFEALLEKLKYRISMIKDASFFDFIDRLGNFDIPTLQHRAHPWLHLFIPKSGIHELNDGVFAAMLPQLNDTSSTTFLFYPVNRNKWDEQMSAVLVEEEVSYMFGLLHSTPVDSYSYIDEFNTQILEFCKSKGIEVKQYLPYIGSKKEWKEHFGKKWGRIKKMKAMFDPKRILSPGQRIFNSAYQNKMAI